MFSWEFVKLLRKGFNVEVVIFKRSFLVPAYAFQGLPVLNPELIIPWKCPTRISLMFRVLHISVVGKQREALITWEVIVAV